MGSGTKRELRLALGMRGGVSLAVWIGGACAEIDELRRSPGRQTESAVGTDFWTRLTEVGGYDAVVVDVMAGASAGGLNGVLLAASEVYGVPFDAIRDTWLDVGSTQKLVRTKATEEETSSDLRWLSLFRGDGHMFQEIVDALRRTIDGLADAARPTSPPRIDLRLSATHVEPVLRSVRSPADEQLSERRFATGFRFRSPDEAWLETDFPRYAAPSQPGRSAFEAHLCRLALAARTTSSYPGAFEAASVRSGRRPDFTPVDDQLEASIAVDMAGILADRSTNGPFVLADGGIVDNIPLGLALDAVASAPAAGPTDRFLVYLHPGAPAAPMPTTSDEPAIEQRRRSVASVLRAAIQARLVGEDIAGDIAAIDEHNRAIDRAVAVRQATFGGLTNRGDLMQSSARVRSSYLRQRADEDRRLIGGLLDDPIGFLGDDPFPSTAGGAAVPDARWRSPLQGYSRPWLEELDDALFAHLSQRLPTWHGADGAIDGEVFITGSRPLLRVTQSVLEWARHVESLDASVGGAVKGVLYRVLAYIDAAVEMPRRMAWVALFATAQRATDDVPDPDAADVVATVLARLSGLTQRSRQRADQLATALLGGDDAELEGHVVESLTRVDQAVESAWGAAQSDANSISGVVDIRSVIAEKVLIPQAEALRAVGGSAEANPETLEPGGYLDRVLAGGSPVTIEVLAALEVACYAEHATGTPGRRPIEFVRLSAANPTPLAPRFVALKDDAAATGRYWDPGEQAWAEQRGIHVELKLAGNELANFSAFLRDEWRANDWMWGRLDAVSTLVDLLVTTESLVTCFPDPVERVDAIRRVITNPSDDRAGDEYEQIWATHGQEITAELTSAGSAGSLDRTRAALVARRQWEILAEELPGDGSVSERISGYRVGAEVISDPPYRAEVEQRFKEIADAASQVVLATAHANDVTRYGTPDKPTLRGRGVRRLIRAATRFATRRLTRPS